MLSRAARAAPLALRGVRAKGSTGIVGLAVEPEANAILTGLYTKTLAALETLPANSAYRSKVEEMTTERVNAIQSSMQQQLHQRDQQLQTVLSDTNIVDDDMPSLPDGYIFTATNEPEIGGTNYWMKARRSLRGTAYAIETTAATPEQLANAVAFARSVRAPRDEELV